MGITELLNKGLAHDVLLASWCPTMDLLAVVASNNTLSVHRLNWQRLWSLPLPCTVTALCWKGDGKMLAVGLEDGSLQLLHAEDGEAAPLHDSPGGHTAAKSTATTSLCSLSWTAHEPCSSKRPLRRVPLFPSTGSTRVCPGMDSLLEAQVSADSHSGAVPDSKLLLAHAELAKPSRGPLNIICASSRTAKVSLLAFGDFLLAELRAKDPTTGAALACSILHRLMAGNMVEQSIVLSTFLGKPTSLAAAQAELTGDLRILSLVIQHSNTGRIDCQTQDVSCIADLAPELTTLIRQHHQLNWYCTACEEALERAATAWSAAMGSVRAELAKLQALLADYSIESTPQAELCILLTTGRASAALQQFLVSHLGDAGVKRLARGVDAAVHTLHGLLVDVMQPGLEGLAFTLSDTAGLARCSPWTEPVPLEEEAVQEALSGAHALILLAEALRLALVRAGVHYRALFAWLLTTVRRMSNDEPAAQKHHFQTDAQALCDFIHGQLFQDAISPQLTPESEAAGPLLTPTPGVQSLLKLFLCDSGSAPLHRLLKQLRPSFRAIFAPIPQALSSRVPVLAHVHLATLPARTPPRLAFKASQEEGQAAVLCLTCGREAPGAPQRILVARIGARREDGRQAHQISAGVLAYACDGEIADIGLYKDNALAVLTTGDTQHQGRLAVLPSAALARQPLPEIAHHMSGFPIGSASSWTGEWEALSIAPREAAMSWQSEGVRSIELPAAPVHATLAVSAERGVACAFVGVQRAVVLDLEDDAADDEEASEDADSSGMEES